MTEFNLDDIQYDENHATQQRIAQLNHKKQVLISRLAFHALVQTGVAGYTVGKHFGGAGAGILGALAGYMLTRNNKMEPIDREIMMKKIKAIDSEIASLQRKNVSQQHANTGIMSADELQNLIIPNMNFMASMESSLVNLPPMHTI